MPETNVVPLDRTPDTVKVDNLIRRALKVRDPEDPAQVAKALLQRYSGEAQNLKFEREGLPFQRADGFAGTAPPTRSLSYDTDAQQATDDVERDLQELLRNTQLKDVTPELQGWARAIRTAAADGLDAARSSLDPRQRDRAFAARRLLGDYSRLSRYIGALSGPVNPQYRRLAQSVDILAGLILVLIGDALAKGSVTRGTLILQVPASELIERRDAAVNSLRVLVGSTQQAFGPNEWPRGLVTYQRLVRRLDESGQSDLRVMLDESSLARVLDELIDLAAGNTPDGLRALGSTAEVSLNRLRRLVLLAQDMIQNQPGGARLNPESPPLAAFLTALNLFAEGFQYGRVGARILFIARSPLLAYGLFGLGAPDLPTRRLLQLVQHRGRIAELIDCFLGCRCDREPVFGQVLLDTLLQASDRAIDLYALGSDPLGTGEPEWRAMAYAVLIEVFLQVNAARAQPWLPPAEETRLTLELIRDQLGWPLRFPPVGEPDLRQQVATFMHHELSLQLIAEQRWEDLARSLTPACLQDAVIDQQLVRSLIRAAIQLIGHEPGVVLEPPPRLDFEIPPHHETSLDSIANDVRANGT